MPENRFIDDHVPLTLEGVANAKPKSRAAIARALLDAPQGLNILQLLEKTNLTITPLRNGIHVLRVLKLAHISGWERTGVKGLIAKYAAGDLPDVTRRQAIQGKDIPPAPPKVDVVGVRLQKMAQALVPKRNAQQQYAVNAQYWNWISGGAYGTNP